MKNKIILAGVIFTAVFSVNNALAAEDIVYYQDYDLDAVVENYPNFDWENYKPKDLVNEKEKENKGQTKKEDEPTKENEPIKENEPKKEEETVKEDLFYHNKDGSLAKGLTDTGKVRKYFDKKTGKLVKSKIIKNENIHADDKGEAHYIGWDYYKGKLGYYDPKTGYAKGLKTIGNITYGFDDSGSIFRKQNRVINGQNYYFNNYGEAEKTNGSYNRGWVGDRYYYKDGKPAEGLANINGKKYAFHERSLRLLRNINKVFDHKMYWINARGEAIYQYDVAHAYLSRGTGGAFRPGFSQNLMRKTPYFSQHDRRWASRAFASSNMSNLGCGPTTMAMVLNRKLNTNDIYPTNTMAVARDYSSWDGTDWQYFIEGVEAYGLKSYDIPVQKDAFVQALKDNPIVVRVGPGYFTDGGHYMVIDSYKDGAFTLNDPNNMRRNTMDRIPWWRLRREVTVAWEIK